MVQNKTTSPISFVCFPVEDLRYVLFWGCPTLTSFVSYKILESTKFAKGIIVILCQIKAIHEL